MADDQKHKDRLKKALDAMIFLPHLKDRQAQSVLSGLIPDDKAPRSTGRPWDRGDLFRRLKTFKSSTWFAKPNSISAEECARRGWQNTDADVITCESCKAVVSCPIPMQLLPDEAQQVAEKYSKQICESHAIGCPWASTTCSISLLHFPKIPKSTIGLDFEERSTTLRRVLCLPPLAPSAVETMCSDSLGSTVAQVIENGPFIAETTLSENLKNKNNARNSIPEDALLLSSGGVATCDQEAVYTRRLRAIALCGWGLEVLSSSASTAGDQRTVVDTSSRVGPESSMLCCTLCGAKAGLWTNFPQCTPQNAAGGKKTQSPAAAVGKGNGQPTTTPSKAITIPAPSLAAKNYPQISPGSIGSGGGGGLFHRQVAVNVATTIAGGSLDDALENNGGGFGGVFGRTTLPVFGSPPFAAPAAVGAAETAGAAAHPDGDEETDLPVFGFAALRAAEPGATSSTQVLLQQGAKRRRDDAAWVEATIASPPKADLAGGDNAAGVDKRQRTAIETETMPPPPHVTIAAAAMPTQAVLQEYRSMQSTPLDPISLHRPFCPWVHAAGSSHTGSGSSDRAHAVFCGWQWYAQQLGPESSGLFGSPGAIGGGNADDDEGNGAGEGGRAVAWNPAAVLRNALSKVEVKKS